jgi:hypothetical protein
MRVINHSLDRSMFNSSHAGMLPLDLFLTKAHYPYRETLFSQLVKVRVYRGGMLK